MCWGTVYALSAEGLAAIMLNRSWSEAWEHVSAVAVARGRMRPWSRWRRERLSMIDAHKMRGVASYFAYEQTERSQEAQA